ncbi:MAG: hypothetical protein KDD62_06630, partial [Bdellovibrionales bacterium]|nr:hypothetical protein [Bdellovibrionales bacterium]
LTPFTQGDCSEQTRISGDYLSGFFQGTQQALFESERSSIVITLQELSVTSLGALLALFERFVGIYAELINVNAYHQPGVEAGKKAAEQVVELQKKALQFLESDSEPQTIEALAEQLGAVGQELALFRILRRLVANGRLSASDSNLFQASFSIR